MRKFFTTVGLQIPAFERSKPVRLVSDHLWEWHLIAGLQDIARNPHAQTLKRGQVFQWKDLMNTRPEILEVLAVHVSDFWIPTVQT